MIPKTIHQIWVGDFKIPLREQSLIEKLKESHSDYDHIFWTDELVLKNESILNMPEEVRKKYDYFYQNKNYVECADILRIVVINRFGGLYLDVDWDVKNKLDYFLNFNDVYFHHDDNDLTIPNGIFFAQKNSDILKFCIDQIGQSYWYGPSWFGETIKQYFELPNETSHKRLRALLDNKNSLYYKFSDFEEQYAKHLSLYSWEPKTWEKLKDGQQL
jgi:mannosyltransferase OCH1-like enzyme